MQLTGPQNQRIEDEFTLLGQHLTLNGTRILELGCGAAQKTLQIAEHCQPASIIAAEVDTIQHTRNLERDDTPACVSYQSFPAQAIPLKDSSVDVVMMFKSLHHVPVTDMSAALAEITRVLRPGGKAWISEPVFAGDFNEIIRLFHDEQAVRQAAFSALESSVARGQLLLEDELFFLQQIQLDSFEEFDQNIIRATHSDHSLDQALYEQVRETFLASGKPGQYEFAVPMRVDLLGKPI